MIYAARGPGERIAQYRLEGLDLTLISGGPQIAFKGDARLQPGAVALKVSDGVVTLGPTRTLTDAPVRAKVAVDGKDIRELTAVAVGPSPELGGAVKGTLAVAGTVAAPTAAGEVQLSNLTATQSSPQCAEPRRRTLTIPTVALNAAWQNPRFTGKPLTAKLAGGTITAQLTATLDRGVQVQLADLGIKALPLDKVLVDFLCEGYAVTGPLDLTGAVTFETRDIVNTLTGPGQLHVGSGKVVGPKALALVGSVVRVGGALSAALGSESRRGHSRRLTARVRVDRGDLHDDQRRGDHAGPALHEPRDEGGGGRGLRAGDRRHEPRPGGQPQAGRAQGQGDGHRRRAAWSACRRRRILKSVDPEKAEKGLRDLLKRFNKK